MTIDISDLLRTDHGAPIYGARVEDDKLHFTFFSPNWYAETSAQPDGTLELYIGRTEKWNAKTATVPASLVIPEGITRIVYKSLAIKKE